MSIYRLKTDKQIPPAVRKVWLCCAKGRSYKPTSRDRLTSSCMTGCEFNATITRTELGQALEIQDPSHNHPAFLAPAVLPQNHKRSNNTTKTIRDMTFSSIGAIKILTNLLKKDIIIDL